MKTSKKMYKILNNAKNLLDIFTLKNIKRTYRWGIIFTALLFLWMLSGQISCSKKETGKEKKETLATVMIQRSIAKDKTKTVTLFGTTESDRKVELKADMNGNVALVEVNEGESVNTSDIIARIATSSHAKILSSAKAELEEAEKEYKKALKNKKNGKITAVALSVKYKKYSRAKRDLENAKKYAKNTIIRAPFSGRVEKIFVEIGDSVITTSRLVLLVDNNPMIIKAQLPEKYIGTISKGEKASIRFANKKPLEGVIRFVSNIADPATRSFLVEMEIDNNDGSIPEGITSEVTIPIEKTKAHQIKTSSLALNNKGEIGVKLVDKNNVVKFYPIEIIDHDNNGLWVVLDKDEADIITLGHGFVKENDKVRTKRK